MAKVKKMAFGGMGRMASGMGASRPGMRQAPMQSRGALGGNQAPAGANLLQAYQAQPGQGAGVPNYAKPYIAQAGQPSAPPASKLAGMGAFMKKGGMAKAYGKGGDVQSESSKLDQKNAEMDKAQEEGFKRYQAEQAKEAKANADSRKSMPFFNFGKPEKKAKGGTVKKYAKGGDMESDKEIARKTPEDVARTNASRAYHKGPKAQEAFQSQMKNESPELKAAAREALQKEYRGSRDDGGGGRGGSGGGGRGGAGATGADLLRTMNPQKLMKKGGKVSSASSRADGCAVKGKTKGRMV